MWKEEGISKRGDGRWGCHPQWKLGQLGKETEKPEDKRTSFTGGKKAGRWKEHIDRTENGQDAEHGVGKHSYFGHTLTFRAKYTRACSTYSPLMSIQEPKIPATFSRNRLKHLAVFLILLQISVYREKHPSKYQLTFQFKQNVFIWELANIMKHWSADATPENGI